MSTVKTNQVTHLSNTGTANVQLDSSGNTTVADLTANSVTAQSVTLSNNLTVNGNTTIGNASSDTVTFNATVSGSNFEAGIIGEMRMWSTGTAPTGWLICNGGTIGAVGSGATHESANYSQLFDLVKGSSGAGLYGNTGTESFASGNTVKLPDFRGRMPVGVGQQANTKYNATADDYTSSGTNFGISNTGGTEDHKITENELASHTHTALTANAQAALSDSGHRHAVQEAQLAHTHGTTESGHSHNIPTSSDWSSDSTGTGSPPRNARLQFHVYENPATNVSPRYTTGTKNSPNYFAADAPFDPMDNATTGLTVDSATPNVNEAAGAGGFIDSANTGITDTGHNHTVTVNNTGDSGSNPTSILNPYLAINFIIKF